MIRMRSVARFLREVKWFYVVAALLFVAAILFAIAFPFVSTLALPIVLALAGLAFFLRA